jgi:hypothetical protein
MARKAVVLKERITMTLMDDREMFLRIANARQVDDVVTVLESCLYGGVAQEPSRIARSCLRKLKRLARKGVDCSTLEQHAPLIVQGMRQVGSKPKAINAVASLCACNKAVKDALVEAGLCEFLVERFQELRPEADHILMAKQLCRSIHTIASNGTGRAWLISTGKSHLRMLFILSLIRIIVAGAGDVLVRKVMIGENALALMDVKVAERSLWCVANLSQSQAGARSLCVAGVAGAVVSIMETYGGHPNICAMGCYALAMIATNGDGARELLYEASAAPVLVRILKRHPRLVKIASTAASKLAYLTPRVYKTFGMLGMCEVCASILRNCVSGTFTSVEDMVVVVSNVADIMQGLVQVDTLNGEHLRAVDVAGAMLQLLQRFPFNAPLNTTICCTLTFLAVEANLKTDILWKDGHIVVRAVHQRKVSNQASEAASNLLAVLHEL